MAHLTFYWDTWAIFDDDDVFRMIQREDYEGETWEECCDECVRYCDWDDSHLVKGYESNVIESNRQLKEISTDENGDEVSAPQEVYDYYQNKMEKIKRKRKKEKLIRMINQLNFESPCINNCKLNQITKI